MAKQTQAGNRQVNKTSDSKSGKGRATGTGKKKKVAGKRSVAKTASLVCTVEERHRMICEQAYFLAEKRGFRGGGVLDDWLQAEAMVDAANISRAVMEDRDNAI